MKIQKINFIWSYVRRRWLCAIQYFCNISFYACEFLCRATMNFCKQKYFRICIHTKDLLRCLKMVICILHGVSVLNSAVSITIMHNLVMLREEKKHIRKRKKNSKQCKKRKKRDSWPFHALSDGWIVLY